MTTLAEVKRANRTWFSNGNQRFFGDIAYAVRHGKVTHKPYLVRSTYAWSDMFGQPKRMSYRLNPIGEDLKIRPLLDEEFRDLEGVETFLAAH